MRRRIRPGRAAALAVTGLLLTAGAAGAAQSPRLAVAPDGTAHALWSVDDTGFRVGQWGTRSVAGAVSQPEVVTPGGQGVDSLDLAVAPTGRGVVVWASGPYGTAVVKLRRRAADGSLSPAQTLSGNGAESPRVEMDADGDAVVMWTRSVGGRRVLETRRRNADGSLSAVKRLSASSPSYSVSDQNMAVDPAGNAVFTWIVEAPLPYVQARRRAADGSLSPVQNLTSGTAADFPNVGVDAQGNAVFAWQRSKGSADVIQVRRRTAAGSLSATRDVSGPHPDFLSQAEVAVAPDGAAIIAWHPMIGAPPFEMRALSSAGTLGPIETVVAPAVGAGGGRVGLDADGDAVFAWRTKGNGQFLFIQTRARTAAGAWSPIDDLSPLDGTVGRPELGVEPGGGATVVWVHDHLSPESDVEARRRAPAGELSAIDQLSS